ncbi:MAG: hypothetical protein POELPBGB_03706 [Bacteroidia bacterium]|nr:hypothetical protein [Bacteroidia bacterium]
MELLDTLSNVFKVEVYYRWNLITVDPDDNKFTDCAIAGGCNFIVTQDHHFNGVKNHSFPPISVINLEQFRQILVG